MPDRHHPVASRKNPKWDPVENKSQKSGKFSDAKERHPRTTIYHAIDHNFTTKSPHQIEPFPQNPLKNSPCTTKQKIAQKKSGSATAEPLCR
jgi:hypothetical protein